MFFCKVYAALAILLTAYMIMCFYKEVKHLGKLHKYGPYQWAKVFLYFSIVGSLWGVYALYLIIKQTRRLG